MLHYYGTSLDYAGHYLWDLTGEYMRRNDMWLGDLPFNPEELPRREPDVRITNGHVRYYMEGGYTICAVEGSCYDDRPGSKSIFFIKEEVGSDYILDLMQVTPSAVRIINKMPFLPRFYAKTLTPAEIKKLPWSGGERFGLVDTRTTRFSYGADTKEWLEDVLRRMTFAHPLFPHLQLVER